MKERFKMRLTGIKYLNVLSLPLLAFISFQSTGWLTFLPMIHAFGVIPLLELFSKSDPQNLTKAEEEVMAQDRFYDWMLYLMLPVQFILLGYFLFSMQSPGLSWVDQLGRISGMGVLCGTIGINVAHELGHRKRGYEQLFSKMLLLSSLYMHFFIEHNKGHHRRVSTQEDPASARLGETLYAFWIRSVVHGYLSAWHIERDKLKKLGCRFFSFKNEMLMYQLIQGGFLLSIGWAFGWSAMGCFVLSAMMGFLLLETVNYIEHYGLQRQKKGDAYERVMPHHSWNSDHLVGRMMLFELSRHSDHHFMSSRKYQTLRHLEDSPQMPTGYPGMMLLALVPPLWFGVMNDRIWKGAMVGV